MTEAGVSALPFMVKVNAIYGAIVAVASYIFGIHWRLFALFLILNVIDYVTGCLKSHINNKTNSTKGLKGALKKLGYWLMIVIAFLMDAFFTELGNTFGVDLHTATQFIGWFILATLIVNEFRSIIENFVEAGYESNILDILKKGLAVANKAIDGTITVDEKGDDPTVDFVITPEELEGKNQITLQVRVDK